MIPTSSAQADNLGAAESLGAALLHRGGYARAPSGRQPVFLPLGARVLANLEAIVRRELDAISAHEIAGASLWSPSSIAREAGEVLKTCSLSRKSLPITAYQLRSSSALVCAFDEAEAWADASRARLEAGVRAILFRAGLPPATAECGDADDLATRARLFWIAHVGSSKVELCFDRASGYAATSEVAERVEEDASSRGEASELESVLTPNIRTVRDVADHLGVRTSEIIKTIVVLADGEPILAAVRGDRALSLSLVRRALPARCVQLAAADVVQKLVGCEPGFVGPIDSPLRVVADSELRGVSGLVCGAGEADTHLRGVDLARDAKVETWAPLGAAVRGDTSPRSGAPYEWLPVDVLARVASPGNQDAIDLGFTIANGREPREKWIAPIATTAAIDLFAILLAAADRHAEPKGIAWPSELAPFAATISVLKVTDEACSRAGDKIYRALKQAGVSVLLDDRTTGAAAKLSDAALIGAPVRMAIGPRSIANREVEIRARFIEDPSACAVSDAAETALALLAEVRRKERSAWT